ncbi:MAG: hypothetical protein HQL73_01885 [Magnetococcales bacterium]|nr:hypothetical protein [Magnetococcales bacterium]
MNQKNNMTKNDYRLQCSFSKGILFLAAVLGMAGCASGPSMESRSSLTAPSRQYDRRVVLLTFRQDQERRRLLPGRWRVDGTMETVLKDDVRRHRMELISKKNQHVTMRVFGPFKNVVLELTMIPEWLRLVNASERVTLEVAADSKGMAALTGLAFNPAWLYPALVGCVGDLGDGAVLNGATLEGENRSGEHVTVDAANGLIKSRIRHGTDGRRFSVNYGWPEKAGSITTGLVMPQQVEITLDDGSKLSLTFNQWKFSSGLQERASAPDSGAAFPVLYPEIGDGPPQ